MRSDYLPLHNLRISRLPARSRYKPTATLLVLEVLINEKTFPLCDSLIMFSRDGYNDNHATIQGLFNILMQCNTFQ